MEQNSKPVIMGVEEVMHALGISRPYAYRIIRMLKLRRWSREATPPSKGR